MMKKLRQIFFKVFDREIELRERIIRLIILTGIMIAISCILESFFVIDMRNMLIPFCTLLVTFLISGIATFRFRKVDFSAILIAISMIFLIFPAIFFGNGGINGGGTIWFIIGLFYCFLVFNGKTMYLFLTMDILVILATYLTGYLHPEYIAQLTSEKAVYVDSFFSVIVIGFSCGMIYRYQKSVAQKEQEIAVRQNEELEAISNSRSNFFTNMSHELRTPLNTIIGLNEMIRRESQQEIITEYSQNVSSAARMLISLVNDIIDLSKMEMKKMEIVETEYHTKELIHDLVDIISVQMEAKKLNFNLEIDENLPSVLMGDERHIKQVMLNLLNNAVKYTEKGSVTLSVSSEKVDDDTISLHFSVIDTGIGIRKEDMESLYDIFKRVDTIKNLNVQGSGLGLTITKQLVNLMGGDVKVDSIYTKGSTFSIQLNQKVIDETPVESIFDGKHMTGEKEEYQPLFEASEAKILIVDDNQINARVVSLLLEKTGMQVDCVSSGEECLIKTKEKYYHVILMDYQMNDMDGAQAMMLVRKQDNGLCKNSAFILLTANSLSDTIRIAQDNNFDGYLEKPIQADLLESEILRLLPVELIEKQFSKDSGYVTTITTFNRNRKKKILVTTDCASDLPRTVIEKYEIKLMYLYIQTPSGRFADTLEIDSDNVGQFLENNRMVAKAVSVSVEEYEKFFADALSVADQVIHVSMAKDSGKSYGMAEQAAKCFENVTVIDSSRISGGEGILAVKIAQMVESGKKLNEICETIDICKKKNITRFLIPTPDFLHQSGYISTPQLRLCKLFGLHPVLGFKQSKLGLAGAKRGPLDNARKQFIRELFRQKDAIDSQIVFITHASCSTKEIEMIRAEVLKCVPFEQVIIQKASFSVSCSAGMGSIGISFNLK